MESMKKLTFATALFAGATMGGLVGCEVENDSPTEQAAENLENAGENAENAMENAAERTEEAAEKAKDAAD